MIEDIVSDIVAAMESEILGVLGSSYKELAYKVDVSRNNFRQSNDRYGVLHGTASQLSGVTRHATFSQVFQVILTKGYVNSSSDDSRATDASLELYGQMLEIQKQLINTKAGVPATVLHVEDTLDVLDPEYIEDQKVTILRANVEILYRFDLV